MDQPDINPNELPIEILEQSPFVQELMTDASRFRDLTKEVKVPYIIPDRILLSEGVWNNVYYDEKEIKKAIENTDWSKKEFRSLFLDHKDSETSEWVGEVTNVRYVPGKGAVGDLVIVDPTTAIKLAYGAKFAISPKVEGDVEGNRIKNFRFLNNSIVINPACKTTWINNREVSVMDEEVKMNEEEMLKEEVLSAWTDFVKKMKKKYPDMPFSKIAEAFKKKLEDEPEEPEKKPEEEKKEEKPKEQEKPEETTPAVEENKESELESLLKEIRDMLKKEKKYPEPDKKKKEEYPDPTTMSEKDEEIKKLREKIEELNERLNEPEKVTAKAETKVESLEEKVKKMSDEELDEAFAIQMLKAQGTIVGR